MSTLASIRNISNRSFKVGTQKAAHRTAVDTITLTSFGGTDSFKVTFGGVESAAFVRGTSAASTDLQTALRTLMADANLTVSGTTDAGPFVVTYVGGQEGSGLTVTSPSGCTGAVARTYTAAVPTISVDIELANVRRALRRFAGRFISS